MLYKIKFIKPFSIVNENYLSISTCRAYKGIFAIVIIFHHLAQKTENGLLFQLFSGIGYLGVSVFFFFSGYGLLRSYINSENYKKGFLFRRLSSILIPYVIVTFLYWLMNYAIGNFYTIKDVFVAIVQGEPIALNSWYVINILAFYIVFWILMVLCQKHYCLMIVGGLFWYVFYVAFCLKMHYGGWWYNSSFLVSVGMIWAVYEKRILDVIKQHYISVAVSVGVLLAFLFFISFRIVPLGSSNWIVLIMTTLKAILFTICVLLFSLRFVVENKILDFLGTISFEIYLLHGLFMVIFRNNIMYIQNELLWCILVLFCTIALAFLLHIVFDRIVKNAVMFMQRG